jgi:hypothetical protein
VILLINEQEDPKTITFTDASGARARLVLMPKSAKSPGQNECRISMTDYDQIRKNEAAAKVLDAWKAAGAIRVLAIAADPKPAEAAKPAA